MAHAHTHQSTDATAASATFAATLELPPRSAAPEIDRISQMPLSEFAAAGMVVRVRSQSLGRTVLFASDNASVDNQEGLDVFRASDLMELLESPKLS